MSKLGERLNKLRQEHGLTQQELADIFHISNSTISSYETGARIPDVDFLLELSRYYNTSSDYILGLSDNKLPLDIINSVVTDDVSYQAVFEKIQKLSLERKRLLIALLDDLYLCSNSQGNTLSADNQEN